MAHSRSRRARCGNLTLSSFLFLCVLLMCSIGGCNAGSCVQDDNTAGFLCADGTCIAEELKCNGEVDCPNDDSDESPSLCTVPPTVPPDYKELRNERWEKELEGDAEEELYFYFVIPSNVDYLTVEIHGGEGDADLRAWYDNDEQTKCQSENSGNEDFCLSSDLGPAGGRQFLYVVVYGVDSFSDVRLRVRTISILQEFQELPGNNQWVEGLSGDSRTEFRFFYLLPRDISTVRLRLKGGTGDADLYALYDHESYACKSENRGTNSETCTIQELTPLYRRNILKVMVASYYTFSDARLRVVTT